MQFLFHKTLRMLPGECWWGGVVTLGHIMPLTEESCEEISPDWNGDNDQYASLFLSSKGRYLYSKRPFLFKVNLGQIQCDGADELILGEGYENLRGAYRKARELYFPQDGKMPDQRFFTCPQYNTWIELEREQTTDSILRYARGILEHGLPAGILMIDEGWAEDYGVFEFNRRKIPDPKFLIDELHKMGFSVMLWVTPMVASAGSVFLELEEKNYLLRTAEGKTAIREWWNGYSAVLDLSNPQAEAWFQANLHRLQEEYGVDGFKFDAGDAKFYRDDDRSFRPMLTREQTRVFNEAGVVYPLNEFRAAWNFGGRAIVSRLHDKGHWWDKGGLANLIPNTIVQGLLGYTWCCPDMVGGGLSSCFTGEKALDEELFVRWAQANAWMGMLQMSVSPWRVLSAQNAARVTEAMRQHAKLGKWLYDLALQANRDGEPLVRCMEYEFSGQGMEKELGQFIIGDYLAAPVLEKGSREKTVRLPAGFDWKYVDGKVYSGGQEVTVSSGLDTIPVFEKVRK